MTTKATRAYKTEEERKGHAVHLRFNDEELNKLEAVAEAMGRTKSATIRFLIEEEYRRLGEYR